jgi:hypothetical protein
VPFPVRALAAIPELPLSSTNWIGLRGPAKNSAQKRVGDEIGITASASLTLDRGGFYHDDRGGLASFAPSMNCRCSRTVVAGTVLNIDLSRTSIAPLL